ncbi:urease accessory protein UreF [Geodermatophilus nigrescens]|uniref:Urease accessory protein UreF n=1 Tax=Geodermatophilus nigrescens TaxID=1070870 RepID=A0A1M5CPZ7_9ACTN|nr:urease accessory UreF family protein [Geodermatophilus nigrescens]SHF56677.1 urease accessory protein [Geodermatophilus nigrescens]
MTASLLTLADSRLPAGGHTHSGGVEQAIAAGLVRDPASLAAFLLRRLVTSGAVAAGLAAAACRGRNLPVLDAEADARTPSPALRAASRQQGRGLVRVGRRAWPSPLWDALPAAPHHPVALGVAAAAGGLTPRDAAAAAAYLSVSGPATAAQRLLAMDPLTVAAVTARLAPEIDAVAEDCLSRADGELSADTDPLLDLLAEVHATRGDRFFAS